MNRGLLATAASLVVAACSAGGPTPAASPTPTRAPVASTSPAPSTAAPSTPPTATVTPAASPSVAPSVSPPAALAWIERSEVAAGPSAREDHTWTLDGSGQTAYLFGGRTADGPQADLWQFDLLSDTWTELRPSGPGPAPRFGHTATWAPGVGLVVWSGQGSRFFDDIWAYDPLLDAWRELPSRGAVPEARYGSCAALGPDGRLWISHGFTQDDGRFADTRAYDFGTGDWADVTPDGDVPLERCLHDCFWSAGRLVLYGGQTTGVAALGDIWAYDPATGSWSQGPDPGAPPRQLYALASLDGNAALVFGGGSLERGYLNDAWVIDPLGLGLAARPSADPLPAARSGAALLADPPSGRMLLFGGRNEGGVLGDLWELAPGP